MKTKKTILLATWAILLLLGTIYVISQVLAIQKQNRAEMQLNKVIIQRGIPLREIHLYVITGGRVDYGYSAEWRIDAGTNVELTAVSRRDKHLYRKAGSLSLCDFSRVWVSAENEGIFLQKRQTFSANDSRMVIHCNSQIDGKSTTISLSLHDAERSQWIARLRHIIETRLNNETRQMPEQPADDDYGRDILFRLKLWQQ
jgi:N-methylhydantoinase A/oxoprolinase/acetone carboxylase beta subunit